MNVVWVGLGGIMGALLRYQVTRWISGRVWVSFPAATLLINVTGAWFLGWLVRESGLLWPSLGAIPMLLLGTGLCGAYTTFSTFSYEWTMLMREGRVRAAMAYFLLSSILGLAAAGVGLFGLPSTGA